MTERASKRANNGGGGHRPVTVGTLVSDVHAAKHLEEELESDVAEAVDGCVDPRTNFYKYCNQTSLHGWPYLASEPGLPRKLIWLLAVGIASAGALYFTIANIIEFIDSRTTTSINTTTASLSHIYFPSITVCNVNQVSRAFLESINVPGDEARMLYDEFIDGNPQVWHDYLNNGKVDAKYRENIKKIKPYLDKMHEVYNWNLSESFVKMANQNCTDLILYSEWKSNVSHTYYDAYLAATDYGVCCFIQPYLDFENEETINLHPTKYTPKHYWAVKKGSRNGIQNGLKLLVDVDGFDYAYFTRGAKGLKIVFGDHRDKPVVNQDGFYIAPGAEVLAAVVPQLFNTTQAAINRFAPHNRDCYLDEEFDLFHMRNKKGFRYGMKNCLYESVLEHIIDNCTCKPIFVNFDLQNNSLESCHGLKLSCSQYWMNNFGSEANPGTHMRQSQQLEN